MAQFYKRYTSKTADLNQETRRSVELYPFYSLDGVQVQKR